MIVYRTNNTPSNQVNSNLADVCRYEQRLGQ